MGLREVAGGIRKNAARRTRRIAQRAGQRLVEMGSTAPAESEEAEAPAEGMAPAVEDAPAEPVAVEGEPAEPVAVEGEPAESEEAVEGAPAESEEAEAPAEGMAPAVEDAPAEQEAVEGEPAESEEAEAPAEGMAPAVEDAPAVPVVEDVEGEAEGEEGSPAAAASAPPPAEDGPAGPVVEDATAEPVSEVQEDFEDESAVDPAAAVEVEEAAATGPPPDRVDALGETDRPHRGNRRALVIAAAFFLVSAGLLAVAVIPQLRDDDSDPVDEEPIADVEPGAAADQDAAASEDPDSQEAEPEPETEVAGESAEAEPETETEVASESGEAEPEPETEVAGESPEAEPEPETGVEPEPEAASEDPDSQEPEPVPEAGEPGAGDPAGTAGEVPESKAVVVGGKIFLEGAVPDAAAAQEIVELAAAILGPENVVDNYVIDPRAGDPNLGNIRVDDPVLFETGSAIIAPAFEPLLGQALALMALRPSVTLTIVGHTDSVGPDDFNLDLSIRRAEAVITWLTERGVEPDRLTAEGRGETEPIETNDTPLGRALNRRIQVFIENLLTDS